MSISSSLSNAVSGMTAAARMAEVVSSNVSNSLTEGYGRRSLNLSSAVVGGRGAGVEIGSVNRHIDRGILGDRRLAGADLGGYQSLASTMQNIQDIVGQAGEGNSLSSRIVAVEAALIDAAADPSSTTRLSAVQNRLQDLTGNLNDASRALQSDRASADASIADQIETLNRALEQVERLNSDISYTKNSGGDPSGLLDQRQQVVDTIADIVPVRELARDGGQIALFTPSGETLIDGQAQKFGFVQTPLITPDMTLQSGGLSGAILNGALIADDGVGRLAGGTLGAAFHARDVDLVDAQNGLDAIAADLISRFQDPTIDPTLAPGDAGLLTDGGNAFDLADTAGLSSRISINVGIDPAAGGTLTRLRDGLNAATPGLSGDASLLQALSEALARPTGAPGDPTQHSAAGRASNFEAKIGLQRLDYEAEAGFASARWTSFMEAEAAAGVDTDYEMQVLLRVEQAYAANARVIQTIDTLMQRLMEI